MFLGMKHRHIYGIWTDMIWIYADISIVSKGYNTNGICQEIYVYVFMYVYMCTYKIHKYMHTYIYTNACACI